MTYPTLWRTSRVPSVLDNVFGTGRELERFFNGFGLGRYSSAASIAEWAPVVDVEETEDEIRVSAELPGLTSDDVRVSVENGVLTIAGEKTREHKEGDEGNAFHMVERQYGRFERSFSLPRSVDPDNVKARFEHGVLRITLPKTAAAKPKRIKVD